MSNWFYVPAAYISLSGFVSLQERVYVMTELGLLKGSCKERLDKSIYFLNIVRISNPLYNHVQEGMSYLQLLQCKMLMFCYLICGVDFLFFYFQPDDLYSCSCTLETCIQP